ncbi:MAG: phosphoenolpyruvate--protein phosphotransferase [Deltaproteobacteria bacterium]|nr:phosphoenolpyruvate--protein phosphotransferase [Deltaproteobacteria bacterium]
MAKRLDADVCSIYLREAQTESLILSATIGLDPAAVSQVRLKVGDGLVGWVASEGEPIALEQAREDARFRYFPETGEERYASLLAAPLVVQGGTTGVLVIQTVEPRTFYQADVELMQTCAQLLAPVVINAQLLALMSLGEDDRPTDFSPGDELARAAGISVTPDAIDQNVELAGIATSRGVAIGPAYRFGTPVDLDHVQYEPNPSMVEEKIDLLAALEATLNETEETRDTVRIRFGPEFAAVFHAQIQILEDKGFVQNLEQALERYRNAFLAIRSVLDTYRQTFERIENEYFRERGADIIDVGQRLMEKLVGGRSEKATMEPGSVVIVDQMLAGLFARLEMDKVVAIVAEHGGSTSHGAIFARTLEIPAVTGVAGVMSKVTQGEPCIVDGSTGRVYLAPDETLTRFYQHAQHKYEVAVEHLDAMRGRPSETQDGKSITLSANVGLINDLRYAEKHGAQGIGLFRTELLALAHRGFPSQEEQEELYLRVVTQMGSRPVTIRTLDLGGDKGIPNIGLSNEENPQLGLRSIRLTLENRRAFAIQLRAILRASTSGQVKLLLPMISNIDELREARALLAEVQEDMNRKGEAFDPDIPVGIMIEVPAAAISADVLASESDFFSIGTNDLTQYTLAVDRGNERVAHLYDGLHPAVISLIDASVKAANRAGIPISICGELASSPLAVPILVGLGIGEFSVVPAAVPLVKEIVRALDTREVALDAHRALTVASAREVRQIASSRLLASGLLDHPDIGDWLRDALES